jgi:uncharacterized protein (DUF342 family)
MNKEELNKEVAKLKQYIDSHAEQVKDLERDLRVATQRLEDADKPKLTNKQFDALHRAIETSVENFDFNQTDAYNVEMGIESDNKVYLEYIEFECHADLYEQIIQDVERLFGVADESDDTETVPSE